MFGAGGNWELRGVPIDKCGCPSGNSSGDSLREERFVIFLDGVAKGFGKGAFRVENEDASVESLCLPLFFTGENGLKPGRGATTSISRGLEMIRERLELAVDFGGVVGV